MTGVAEQGKAVAYQAGRDLHDHHTGGYGKHDDEPLRVSFVFIVFVNAHILASIAIIYVTPLRVRGDRGVTFFPYFIQYTFEVFHNIIIPEPYYIYAL